MVSETVACATALGISLRRLSDFAKTRPSSLAEWLVPLVGITKPRQALDAVTRKTTPVLGPFQYAVLAEVAKSNSAYGFGIAGQLSAHPGAVATTLQRLEGRGLVQSDWGPPRTQRGGKRRRIYRLTKDGTDMMKTTRQHFGG